MIDPVVVQSRCCSGGPCGDQPVQANMLDTSQVGEQKKATPMSIASKSCERKTAPSKSNRCSNTSDDASLCFGRRCDNDCVRAIAAIECNACCQYGVAKRAVDCRDQGFSTGELVDACAEHLRAAFEKYANMLEQTRCICRRVLMEQNVKCCPDHLSSLDKSISSATCTSRQEAPPMLRYRRNALPCLSKQPLQQVSIVPSHAPGSVCLETYCQTSSIDDKSSIRDDCCKPALEQKEPKTAVGEAHPADVERGHRTGHVLLHIEGMDCAGCEKTLARALEGIPGVSRTRVTFITALASFDIDDSVTTVGQVILQAQRLTSYKLKHTDSDDEYLDLIVSANVSDVIHSLPKAITTVERLDKSTVRVTYNSAAIGARHVFELFPGASLAPPAPDQASNVGAKHVQVLLALTIAALLLTIPTAVLAWATTNLSQTNRIIISLVLGTAVQVIAVPAFYRPAISALLYSHVVEMDMLVVLSITAAYGYSVIASGMLLARLHLETEPFFETSTLLISLVLLGRLIAAFARSQAIAAVSLRSLQPTLASLMSDAEKTREIDARLLELGDTIAIEAHAQIVTDGTVLSGLSEVDESMVTGESLPISKTTADNVIAGTMNGGGHLTVQVTRLPGKNTITDIAKLVEDAHNEKPRVQDIADYASGYFVPVVLTIALVVTAVWAAVNATVYGRDAGSAVGSAITYGIAVLAISCPCALGLAVPMVLIITGGKAARAGVIIKTADVIERGFKVTDIIFDKTGTLTNDKLAVVFEQIFEHSTLTPNQTTALVKAMLNGNNHPVSRAVSQHIQNLMVPDIVVEDLSAIPGSGITCNYNGMHFSAGNPRWLGLSQHPDVSMLRAQGHTLCCISDESQLVALFALQADIRFEAKAVIDDLQYNRNLRVHILSGDNQQAVQVVSERLGVSAELAHGNKTPADKQEYVRALMERDKVVLFCGDGTNDAVAVTQASIGVQIAPTTSDVTRATADVVLVANNLTGILALLDVSKAAFMRICFNFIWATLYNIFAILLASGAFVRFRIEPRYAGLGEIVSVLPVVLTAMTLRTPSVNITV